MAARGAVLQPQLRELSLCIIPLLTSSSHKGQAGRIAVVGGSKEYTGAPYYAAMSSLKLGADLSFVFCSENAATPIKTYSPELIVIPVLDTEGGMDVMSSHWLPRLHSLVVGPGLGRDVAIHEFTRGVVLEAVQRSIHLVVDADGIALLIDHPDLLDGCKTAVITPNIAEFRRLCNKRLSSDVASFPSLLEAAGAVAKSFNGNVIVVVKGEADIISDGEKSLTCDVPGTLRRCGGQGDVLAGCMGTWLHWAHMESNVTTASHYHMGRTLLQHYGPVMSAAYAACAFTRTCARLAFEGHGRAMTTPNLLENFSKALAGI